MYAIAHQEWEGGRGGGMDMVRESALKVDPGNTISCHAGELNLRQWFAGLMLNQLSYIPFHQQLLDLLVLVWMGFAWSRGRGRNMYL